MNNTKLLEELLNIYLIHLVKNKSDDFTPELELRFTGCVDGEYSNRPQPLSKDNFYSVLQVFKSIDPSITSFARSSGEYLLRIYPFHNGKSSPFRCEITGLSDIQKYCLTNDWKTCPSARFVRKEKVLDEGQPINDIFMESYAIKASYKREITYVGHQIDLDPQLKEIANNWSKVEKTFRHMNRFSFTSGEKGLIKVDASIVKSSNQDERGNFIPVRDIQQSNVFKNFEKHEVELEINNENILSNIPTQGNSIMYAKTINKELQRTIYKVLVGLQKSHFPIPKDEMVETLEEYIRTINFLNEKADIQKFVGKPGLTSPRNFIGPSSVTLQFENLYENEITGTKAPCVKQNYTVTEKADGERCLMFISPRNKKVYLIDMNMFVRYTGIELNLSNKGKKESHNNYLDGLVIDGEYITKDKNSNPISLFMAFDIYFAKASTKEESSIRNRPFLNYKEGNISFGRYEKLMTYIESLNNAIQQYYTADHRFSKNACEFRVKQFKVIDDESAVRLEKKPDGSVRTVGLGNEMMSLHQSCSEVLAMEYIYNVDGLIFTPSNLAVGATYDAPKTAGPLTKVRWNYSFKWKPPKYNTNDFLVTTVKTETNEDRVTNLIEPYTNTAGSVQMIQYKTLELRCGFSYKKSGYVDAFTKILSMQKMEQIREEYRDVNQYQPVLFYPTDYPDRYSHICHIILDPDDSGNKQMITEEGEMIEDNTIVEFRYEQSNEDGFKWVPLRVRNDKTQEYRKGLKSYGNDYETANGNWKSIMNPITQDMLISGDLPPYEEVKIMSDAYYTKTSAGDRDMLQKFHNYVKEELILSTLQKDQTLIDVACGKAGDLWKWDKAKPSFVFGIDYSRDNIENRFDGAAARYMNYYKDRLNNPSRGTPTETIRCVFATGDSSKNIRTGEAMFNEMNKTVSDAVLGIGGGVRDSVIGNLYGIGSNGFDVCSCQFALHYFFRNISTLEGFMTNVCQNVKMGGTFIGTCYNGKYVFDMLNKAGGGSVTVYSGLEEYWRCLQKYKETEFNDDVSSLGYEIDIYQKSIGLVHTE